MTGVKVFAAEVYEPVNVKRCVVEPAYAMEPDLLKFKAPVPEASMLAPLAPTVNSRSQLTPPPVYFNVPPFTDKVRCRVAGGADVAVRTSVGERCRENRPAVYGRDAAIGVRSPKAPTRRCPISSMSLSR